MLVHICVDAIDQVVRRHYSPRICFSNCDLKRPKIQFTQRSLLYDGVDMESLGFLFVRYEVWGWQLASDT